ncbi:MAG: hypothetical protein AB9842_09285 [Bacteroidales bacterium]
MPVFNVEIIPKNSPDNNETLRQEMIDVLHHAYVYPEKVIDKRFYALDKIFLLRKEKKLVGFCCYFLTDIETTSETIPSVFLGIMAAAPAIQNSGLILKVMEAMLEDLRNTNPLPGHPRLIWATTASPSSLAIFRHYFQKVSPDENNTLRPEHIEYEKAMRKTLLQGKPDQEYKSLVVKDVTPQSIYSEQETKRISLIQKKDPENIFTLLGIDESKGDRLIMIGEL